MSDQTKIWGMSYGLIGDLVMGLPMLTYFEKKYPGSYKYWVIEKKCAITAPLYLNHPLIDRIKITDEWSGFGAKDEELMRNCDVVCDRPSRHKKFDWYNDVSCVVETARLAGIDDIEEVLTEEELKPKLFKWFDEGLSDSASTYSTTHSPVVDGFEKSIGIWPFTTGGPPSRCPSSDWWGKLIYRLIEEGYTIYHYGRMSEPKLSSDEKYINSTHLSYFDQVKASLATKLVIGTDSGSQWVIAAYLHPTITLMTNWLTNHNTNLTALAPVNDNGINIICEGGVCDNIQIQDVVKAVKKRVNI